MTRDETQTLLKAFKSKFLPRTLKESVKLTLANYSHKKLTQGQKSLVALCKVYLAGRGTYG